MLNRRFGGSNILKVVGSVKVLRAGFNDTDIFAKTDLELGGCCFFTEDRKFKYIFKIDGQEATLSANTNHYVSQVIDAFLFYSGFVTSIKDESGNILSTKELSEPYLFDIKKIQPSQFYINEKKLKSCKNWIKSNKDIFIPIVIKNDTCISLDGHTRMRAALDLGYDSVYVYLDDYDETIFNFTDEAIKRQIHSVYDMDIISDKEYEIKWNKFCDDLLERASG